MSVVVDDLKGAERSFVEWLGRLLHVDPQEALARLREAPSSRGVGTRVVDGQFISLDLEFLGESLRDAVGEEARLVLNVEGLAALEEFDCPGIALDALQIFGLGRLRRLDCRENRLRELDLAGVGLLEEVDCSGNDIMVLDTRGCPRLRRLDCSGNDISALLVSSPSTVERLACGRNQIMVLELGDQPHLRELHCYRNALARLALGVAPELRVLDCARNQLQDVELGGCGRLEKLDCSRNRLGALDLSMTGRLTHLRMSNNYVAGLDLVGQQALEEVDCSSNQLRSLELGDLASLSVLDCHGNRLTALRVDGCTALEVLECASNELDVLEALGARLCALDCADNALTELDVSGCPGLARLYCAGNLVEELDIRANGELHVLQTLANTAPKVMATERQRHRILELRRREGLGVEMEDVAVMDSWELHHFAAMYGGGDAEAKLLEVIHHPECDRGTALMIYWTNAPHYFLRYAEREEVQPYELDGWDLLHEIERRFQGEGFTRQNIWFDPFNDKQTRSVRGHDWTVDDSLTDRPVKRGIPSGLMKTSGGPPASTAVTEGGR